MPFITTRTNTEITKEQEFSIKEKLGEAISLLGKSESWLMLDFKDNCRLWFKGDNGKKLAFVEIALIGKATPSQYDTMTEKVCEIISSEHRISSDCIYVKYEEVSNWGYNGFNY